MSHRDPNAENLGWLCVAVAYLAWRGDEVARGLVALRLGG